MRDPQRPATVGKRSRASWIAPIGACAVVLGLAWPDAPASAAAKAPAAAGRVAPGRNPAPNGRFVAATPEQMLRLAVEHIARGGAEGLAGLAIASALHDRVPVPLVSSLLGGVSVPGDTALQDQVRWTAAALSPDPKASRPEGLIRAWMLVGPFHDTGGGLDRHEGPEQEGTSFVDASRTFDRGAYWVRWRAVPPTAITARGVPLDALIQPRQESCSYLASRLALGTETSFVIHVAASGALRVIWDGKDVASSEETHKEAQFDRLAIKIAAAAGEHLLAIKNCSGAIEDAGRVRVRVSDGAGRAKELSWNADIRTGGGAFAQSSVSGTRTPLEATVDVGEHPSIQQALCAGVVRSLVAADDQRSPRAPGLLSRVGSDPTIAPDTLALVGWATPFGADRSGRLVLARERSLRTKDIEVQQFALRRLAALRIEGGYPDWAIAAVQTAPLAESHDIEARWIKALALGSMKTLRAAALQELQALSAQAPETPAVWRDLADYASGFDRELRARSLERLYQLEPDTDCGAVVKAVQARGAQAVSTAARGCLQDRALDAQELETVGQALLDAGRIDDARELFRSAVQSAPNAAKLWVGLSVSSFASGRKEDTVAGGKALDRARALGPGESYLTAEARLRARQAETDDKRLVDPTVFLAIKREHPVREGEEVDRELYWMRWAKYEEDHRIAQVIHYAREIVIPPRAQRDLTENIPSEGDHTEILRARVHRATGGVAFAEEQESEGGRPRIRWPNLGKGDVVEVALRTYSSGPVGRRGDPPFFFMDFAGSVQTHPLLHNEVVVETPVAQPLAIDVLHGQPDSRSDQVTQGWRTVRLSWTRPINVADEPMAPSLTETIPVVVVSTFGSWKDFLDWYRAAVEGFTEPDDQTRRLALDLTKGATTRDEKLRRLFDYVADDIRYVNYVSGEWWLPNRPQQVVARRQGDCDDKAILLITLLKAVGIEATEVLVQTRLTGQPSVLLSKGAAVPLFDHGIAYLPAKNGRAAMWLDATSPQSRLGPLPAMDARAQALFVSEGTPEIVATPSSSPSEHGVDSTWTIRLLPSGGGDLVAQESHVGDHGFVLRSNLLEPDARAQWLEQNLLAGWFSTMKLEGKVAFEPDVGRGEARVTYHARSAGIARREGDDWIVPLAPNTTMTAQLAPLVTRTLPVVLPSNYAPSHQKRVMRIVAPPGYRFADLPPGGEEKGAGFGHAQLQVGFDPLKPDVVVVTRSVVFDMSTIPVDQYTEWRSWLQRVDRLMHRIVRIVPTAGKAVPTKR